MVHSLAAHHPDKSPYGGDIALLQNEEYPSGHSLQEHEGKQVESIEKHNY